MLKALLKKQLAEFFSGLLGRGDKKNSGKKGSKTLMIFVFGFVGISFFFMFFSTAFMMSTLIEYGNADVYFSVFGVIASMLGIFGSVFLTYNTVYEAKDNDLLLSMPIPSWMILFSRVSGLYLTTFMYEALVLIPAVCVYFIVAPFNVLSVVFLLLSLFLLPLFAVSIACVLGWVIAFFASKIRNKSIITVVASLVFFFVYYFFTIQLNNFISLITENAEEVGNIIKRYLFPIYMMGKGCTGEPIAFLAFVLIVLSLFALIYKALSVSFLKLATAKRGMKKVKYKEKHIKKKPAKMAFLKKELLYFKNTPAYMLNSGLGAVMLLIVAVLLLLRREYISGLLTTVAYVSPDSLPVLIGLSLCFVASTNNITSASISLEAKNLWFVKSVPVDIKDVFFGKLMLHILVTGIPLLVADIIVFSAFKVDVLIFIFSVVFTEVFMVVCAVTGLVANLLFPKTDWVNETVPIKQSLASFIGMIFGMFYTMLIIVMWFLIGNYIPTAVFLTIILLLSSVILAVEIYWLNKKGVQKFMDIQ